MGDLGETEKDIVFCKCGREAVLGLYCSEKCRKKKPKQPKRGDYSGYSKYREDNGQYQAIWGR